MLHGMSSHITAGNQCYWWMFNGLSFGSNVRHHLFNFGSNYTEDAYIQWSFMTKRERERGINWFQWILDNADNGIDGY